MLLYDRHIAIPWYYCSIQAIQVKLRITSNWSEIDHKTCVYISFSYCVYRDDLHVKRSLKDKAHVFDENESKQP